MNKSIALATVLATLSAGAAFAQMSGTTEPYGPQPIADVRAAGKGAIVGTVMAVDRGGFLLADASGQIRVASDRLGSESVQPGEEATVVGRMKHGELKARQIVREDGSPAPRHGVHKRAAREQEARGDEGRMHNAHRHGAQEHGAHGRDAQRHGAEQQEKSDNAHRGPERHNRPR